jgi:hypothetical protein
MRYSEFANDTDRKQINNGHSELRLSLQTDRSGAVPVQEPVNPLLDDLLTAVDCAASVSRIPLRRSR